MKISNNEHNKKIIYVQLKDLYAIIEYENNIPIEVKSEIENKIISDLQEDSFIKIEHLKTIEFLEELDWILDYKEFVKKQSPEIEFLYKRTQEKILTYKIASTDMPDDQDIKKTYQTLNHKMNDLKQAIKSIVYDTIDIPLIEDCDTPVFYIEEYSNYKIQRSLNPKIFLIKKTNESQACLTDIDSYVIKELIKFITKQDCEIDLKLSQSDSSVIICRVKLVKQNIEVKQKRKFFSRRKK